MVLQKMFANIKVFSAKTLSLQKNILFSLRMISRRLLRIKIFKLIFSRLCSESRSISESGNELMLSLSKTVDLYYFLLSLPVELKKYAISKIELGLQKFHPSLEEINPNRKFVENKVISVLENNKARRDYVSRRGLRWSDSLPFIKKLYGDIQYRAYFIEYMQKEGCSFSDDLALLSKFFQFELEDREDLCEMLEDQSIYWADDVGYILGIILKMISSLSEGEEYPHIDTFRQPEDKEYALHLLEHSILHCDEYLELLRNFALNWEVDRMAATDVSLIVLGISEVVCCPTIPVKVTINEVVELAKYYSTPNSKLFVNGVLDKIVQHLSEEGKVEKMGRGLME